MEKHLSSRLILWIIAAAFVGSIGLHAQERPYTASTLQRNAEMRSHCKNLDGGRLFARTELFFGTAKPDGSRVTDEEFRDFLDHVITPRFPNGLTALSGAGQFRGSSGMIQREGAVFVILLYPADNKDSSAHIEEIREKYRKSFAQESVLRVDVESCANF
jgi:hypothetical protein